jgi:gliding motility-associated-like protein
MQKFKLLLIISLLMGSFIARGQVLPPAWVNDIGGTGVTVVNKVVTDSQDNIYITGSFQGTVDLSPTALVPHQLTSNGGTDVFFAKYDGKGTLIWCESIGGTGADTPNSICLDDNNNIYITGIYQSPFMDANPTSNIFTLTNVGKSDVFLIKLTNLGGFLWAKQIYGTGFQTVSSVKADHNGNVYIGGSFDSATTFDAPNIAVITTVTPSSPVDGYIAKYTGNTGTLAWVDHFGGTGQNNQTYSLTTDLNNNILVTGRSNDIGINADFIAKYDPTGVIIWIDRITRTSYGPNSIATDLLGNVYLTGFYPGKTVFDVSSPSGTVTATSNTFADGFIAQYDTNGKFIWANTFGQAGTNTYPLDIVTDSKSNIYIAGWFNGNPAFNTTTGKPELVQPYSGFNAFAAKYSSTGKYVWAINVGTTTASTINSGNSIALTSNNEVLLAGQFNLSTDFDPRMCAYNITAQNNISDGFIARYGISPTPVITGFSLSEQKTPAVIDTVNRTISIVVKSGTDVSKLSPTVTVNSGALSPASGTTQDFSAPFTYHITANCTTYDYPVTVTVEQTVSTADAGPDQSACDNSTFTLQANTPQTGTGTWAVISPSSYAPFGQANINVPNAQIKNVPLDTKVTLSWTVSTTGVQKTSADTLVLWNYSVPVIGTSKDYLISTTGGSVTLSPTVTGSGALTYLWQPGKGLSDSTVLNPIASPTQNTNYKLTVTNADGCGVSATFKVIVAYSLSIPSVFTPNQDSINDTWIIKNIEGYPNCEVNVYDRAGEQVFYSKGYSTTWDGTYKGQKLPTGSYYYVIKLNDKKSQLISGSVTVMY